MEVYKDIIGYEGLYQISNYGNLKNVKRGTIKSNRALNKGYIKTVLHKCGVRKHFLMHRLVAQAFIPNPLNKPEVNHKNGNKKDNRLSNLEWCTSKENIIHAIDNGFRSSVGKNNVKAKITEKDVVAIRRLSIVRPIKELAKAFNLSASQVYKIVQRNTWKNVDEGVR